MADFSPTLRQYTKAWTFPGGSVKGAHIMVSDVKADQWCPSWGALGENSPYDITHGGAANLLRTDFSVTTVPRAISAGTMNKTPYRANFGGGWFSWADAQAMK